MSQHKRTNRSNAEWAALLAEHQDSGLSQAAFCKQRGISVYSFRRRYQHRNRWIDTSRSTTSAFTELVPARSAAGLVVCLGETVRIECPSGMAVEAVVQLVRGLIDAA
jgi:hypothetical protein